MDEGEERIELSGHALSALKEFYTERDAQEKRFQDLKASTDSAEKLSMDMFAEDWNASQFWYSDETAELIAKELLSELDENSGIAVVSAPSVYIQLKNLINAGGYGSPRVCLLEYDDRFSVLQGFVKYDFNAPMALPGELKGQFDRIICDPPYLNDDCQTKAALTVRWLTSGSTAHIIVCTGERMAPTIHKIYPGIHHTTFEVRHTKGLSNEFWCYANFECAIWKWAT